MFVWTLLFLFSCKIQQVGEKPSNDGAQVAGDSACGHGYLALQGSITNDFDVALSIRDKENDLEEKKTLKSFTQLLTGPIRGDILTGDLF